MNFKFNLNEQLFDDELDSFLTKDISTSINEFDDEFVDYEDTHSVETVLPGPSSGTDNGIASEIISLINDEWEAIEGYNNAIATINSMLDQNPMYERVVKVLEEISGEENTHVGQLQELLKQISPNVANIEAGKQEAKNQLGLVGGKLPVQSWDSSSKETPAATPGNETEMCTLCDVDDEM